MNNLHLFELINAAPGLGEVPLGIAAVIANWLIYLIPLGMVTAWLQGAQSARRELLQMLLAVLIALFIAQAVVHLWPRPRPFVLHIGTQYLDHGNDPGLPSDHVTVFWSLAFAAFGTSRFAVWGLPLLAAGLAVGWSRVFLGVHFPYDVLAAFPVGIAGAAAAHALRKPVRPAFASMLNLYHEVEKRVAQWLARFLKA